MLDLTLAAEICSDQLRASKNGQKQYAFVQGRFSVGLLLHIASNRFGPMTFYRLARILSARRLRWPLIAVTLLL